MVREVELDLGARAEGSVGLEEQASRGEVDHDTPVAVACVEELARKAPLDAL